MQFLGHVISAISASQTKIRDQIPTENIHLCIQFCDFRTAILIFPFIHVYHSFNILLKRPEKFLRFRIQVALLTE